MSSAEAQAIFVNEAMNDLTEIKVGIARIEEQLKAQADNIAKLAPAADVASLRRDLADAENRISDLEKKQTADMRAFEDKVPSIKEHNDLELRVKKMEGNQSWVIRTVIGAVIMAVLGLIGLKASHGG